MRMDMCHKAVGKLSPTDGPTRPSARISQPCDPEDFFFGCSLSEITHELDSKSESGRLVELEAALQVQHKKDVQEKDGARGPHCDAMAMA